MARLRNQKAIDEFAARCLALRKHFQMSQEDVAKDAEMKTTQYRRIEKGKTNVGISHIQAIAKAYEMEQWQLLKYDYFPELENAIPTTEKQLIHAQEAEETV